MVYSIDDDYDYGIDTETPFELQDFSVRLIKNKKNKLKIKFKNMGTNNATVNPGFQAGNDETNLNGQGTKRNAGTSGQQSSYSAPHGGTRIPGMEDFTHAGDIPQPNQMINKPIVGFLVTVSKTEEGEFWVLRQGQNVIGSGSNCNIILPEASVSGLHAVIAIHRNPAEKNKINVGIIDRGSSVGVFVNNTYIGFNPCQCKNYDKIRIGNYELLLMLFDAVDFDMKKADNFVSTEDSNQYDDRNNYDYSDGTKY